MSLRVIVLKTSFKLTFHRIPSGKVQAPVIMDNKKDEDDEDDTFIVEEDPALQNFIDVVS